MSAHRAKRAASCAGGCRVPIRQGDLVVELADGAVAHAGCALVLHSLREVTR